MLLLLEEQLQTDTHQASHVQLGFQCCKDALREWGQFVLLLSVLPKIILWAPHGINITYNKVRSYLSSWSIPHHKSTAQGLWQQRFPILDNLLAPVDQHTPPPSNTASSRKIIGFSNVYFNMEGWARILKRILWGFPPLNKLQQDHKYYLLNFKCSSYDWTHLEDWSAWWCPYQSQWDETCEIPVWVELAILMKIRKEACNNYPFIIFLFCWLISEQNTVMTLSTADTLNKTQIKDFIWILLCMLY